MSKIITLRKGLDINLRGKAQESLADAPQASEYALSPLDFEGVTPKLLVKVGDEVKAGTPLFFNKYSERVLFTSPVSGTVAAVNRGEKRKVLSVTVTSMMLLTPTMPASSVPRPMIQTKMLMPAKTIMKFL